MKEARARWQATFFKQKCTELLPTVKQLISMTQETHPLLFERNSSIQKSNWDVYSINVPAFINTFKKYANLVENCEIIDSNIIETNLKTALNLLEKLTQYESKMLGNNGHVIADNFSASHINNASFCLIRSLLIHQDSINGEYLSYLYTHHRDIDGYQQLTVDHAKRIQSHLNIPEYSFVAAEINPVQPKKQRLSPPRRSYDEELAQAIANSLEENIEQEPAHKRVKIESEQSGPK